MDIWIIQVQSLMSGAVTGSFDQSIKAQDTKFCIDELSNSTDRIVFTLRNCGSYDVNVFDFAETGYYIDTVKTACIPDVNFTGFNVYDIRTITCPPGSYGTCAAGKCPIRTIKVVTAFGGADTVTYQYAAGN